MKRLITAEYCHTYVKVAYFEDFELKNFDKIDNQSTEKFIDLENAIRTFTNKNNIRIYKIALNLNDNECISMSTTINNKDEDNYWNEIKNQFPNFIEEDKADSYVYDYQKVKIDETTTDVYGVAVPKYIIEDYLSVSIKLNRTLDMLRPQSASIGCAIASVNAGGVFVVDLCMNEINMKVYDNKKKLASSILQEGVGDLLDILKENPMGAAKTVEFKRKVGKIAANITKTIAYYDENRISKKDYKILLIGEGAHITQIKRVIESMNHHAVISPKEFIKGNCNDYDAALAFSMYGMLF